MTQNQKQEETGKLHLKTETKQKQNLCLAAIRITKAKINK